MKKKISILTLFVLTLLTSCLVKDQPKNPFNILFISVDDLRPELGCYGYSHIHSPNLDKLAEKSLVFENAYCQSAICCPSRVSFLTGLRPYQTGINENEVPVRETLPNIETLPQYFKNRGYQAEAHGKVYHQQSGDSLSWDYYDDTPPQRTYNLEKNLGINVIGDGSRRGRPFEDADVDDSLYTDGIITNRALRALDKFDKSRPFFLAVGLMKPHLPFNAPKKYWDYYTEPGKNYNRNLNRPEDSYEHSFMNSAELRNYFGVPKTGDIPPSLQDTLVHGYCACISYMDAQIGRLMRKLEELEVADKTIVVVFGDHGYKLGDFNDWCKNTHYELDTRVPLIIHHPLRNGGKTKSISELVDVYPTLVEANGFTEIPHEFAGISLMPLFSQPELELKQAAFSERPRDDYFGYSVRTKDFRLIKWVDKKNPENIHLELYKYNDGSRMEEKNLVYDDAFANKKEELLTLMKNKIDK